MGMMMPYFYQAGGIPAIFPGLGPIQLLSQAPGILPGLHGIGLFTAYRIPGN